VAAGNASNLTLVGGSGDDDIVAGNGEGLLLNGDEGEDKLGVANTTNATLVGGSGDDSYEIGGTFDVPGSGPGNPVRTLVIAGDDKNAFDVSRGTNATLVGGSGDDDFDFRGGTGTIANGGAGEDFFRVRTGTINTTLVGGSGDDDALIDGGSQIRFEGNSGENEAVVDGGNGILVIGGENKDRIAATNGTNVTLVGGAGDDDIYAANPNDGTYVYGGDGNDRLFGNPTQTLATLVGGSGDDQPIEPNAPADGLILSGEAGNDSIYLTNGSNSTLVGGSGDDTIVSTDASDVVVNGGTGNDKLALIGLSNGATLVGGSGDDDIYAKDVGRAVVAGNDGDDEFFIVGDGGQFYGDAGKDIFQIGTTTGITLVGGSGDETALPVGSATGIVVNGGSGNDELVADGADGSLLFGGDDNDKFLIRQANNTTLYGLSGDDDFDIRGGTDLTALGDLSVYNFTGNDTFTITDAIRFAGYGERGSDLMIVNGGTGVSLYGGSGGDTLRANGGSGVLLAGNSDNDALVGNGLNGAQLFGGLGDDLLLNTGKGSDSLIGEEGNDSYQFAMSTTVGGITITLDEVRKLGEDGRYQDSANFGTDGLYLGALTSAATLNLSRIAGKTATPADRQEIVAGLGVVLFGLFDAVYGTPFADAITGNDEANLIYGFGGNDTISGGLGDDTLVGGAGSNSLTGGDGADTYQFTVAAGIDTIVEVATHSGTDMLDFALLTSTSNAGDLVTTGLTVNLGSGTTQNYGVDGRYTIVGGALAVEGAIGTRFNDTLLGTAANNRLDGGAGNDSLVGGDGNDTLVAGAGDDSLQGGNNDDWYVLSPAGTSRLTDTAGIDTIDFRTAIRGVTFTLALDAGQLQTVDAATNKVALTGAFENLLGSSYNDLLTGNALANDVIGLGGLDTIEGGAGNDYLQGGFTQVVLLDFVTQTRPGEYEYQPGQRNAIQLRLEDLYRPFGVKFTQSVVGAETLSAKFGKSYTVVRFNAGQAGGQSDAIDPRNYDLAGAVLVNAFDYLTRFLPTTNTPATIHATMEVLSYNIAAHELAHQFGLRHADAFGAVGTGYYANGILNSGSYVGTFVPRAGALDTAQHVLASPLSLGTPNAGLIGDPTFGLRESLKLMFSQYGSAVAEPTTAHDKLSTATGLTLAPIIVPNLMKPTEVDYGINGVPDTFAAFAVSVTGSIALNPTTGLSENDWYAFAGKAGQFVTIEIASTTAKRFLGGQIDSILRLFDANGVEIAMNDDDFESQDSQLLDFVLPSTGTFYVVVDTYTGPGVPDTDTGRYELLIYTVARGGEAGNGDLIKAGAGTDTVVTGDGPDVVQISAEAGLAVIQSRSTRTMVDATRLPSYNPANVAGPALVIGVNRVPTFTAAPTKATVTEGKSFALQYTAVDPDGGTQVQYQLVNGPTGAAIDPVTGQLTWSPGDNGKYTFSVRAVDPLGTAATANVTITVNNVAPAVAIDGLPAALTAPEGTSLGLTINANDPSPVDQSFGFIYAWNVSRDNATLASGTSKAFTYVPTNDGTYRIRVTATDKDGGSTTTTRDIVVTNAAPVVTVVPSAPFVPQGSSVTLTATTTDKSSVDTAAGFNYVWRVNGATVLSGLNKTSFSYVPRILREDVVTVAVSDDDDTTTMTIPVTVTNVAPTITGLTITTPAASRKEGAPLTARLTFTDPGSTFAGGNETYTIVWTVYGSNGQTLTGTSTANGSGPLDFNFTPIDNGSYDLIAEVIENRVNGDSTEQLLAGTAVANVAPTLTVSGAATANLNQPYTLTLTPSDVGIVDAAGFFTFRIDWDNNGTIDQTVIGNSGTTVTRTFTTPGTKTIKVTAIDKDGGVSAVVTRTVTIAPVSFVGGVLTVYGTSGGDEIRIRKVSGGALEVMMNSNDFGPYLGVTKIVAYGGNGDDAILVDADVTVPAQLYGEAGDDFLRGGSGNDTLEGGSGEDFLQARLGNDLLKGGADDDVLWAGDGDDTLLGEAGDDQLLGRLGNDFLDGGADDDSIYGGRGADTLRGGLGDDYLQAGKGDDVVYGDDGNDTLRGKSGNDSLYGGSGNDSIWGGGSGDDVLDGGTGLLDSIRGGPGEDTITDPDGAVFVSGGSGNDRITIAFTLPPSNFAMPPVTIEGGSGDDTITITSANANLRMDFDGGEGDDRFTLNGDWNRADIRGGSGYDRLKNNGTGTGTRLLVLHGIELVE